MNRRLNITADVVAGQRRASDPTRSVWVRANAGSGKTHVLTERVMRLLLSGVRPEEILCLTYTKAAAAEMRRRVAARLADWALMADAELVASLTEMEQRSPGAATLARARTLFAHALETPGGLKINTIHAFCESVLHRFPLEAGVPFDFSVIEEAEAANLILATREAVLGEGVRGSAGSGPVETLFGLLSDNAITRAIDAALADGRKLRHVLADVAGAKARLRAFVGAPAGETREAVLRQAETGSLFPASRYPELFAHRPPDPARLKNLGFVERLWRMRDLPSGEALFEAFLKEDGQPYKDRCTSGIRDAALADAIGAEHDRLAELYPIFRRATLVARSEALLDVLAAIVERYTRQKQARSLLDFDDLIERLGDLFANRALADWVKYKLDAGITHILVDESQDTNLEQWRVVREIADEFFVGDSAIERPRTLFGVGDEKQSIYSFQGANPALFGETGRHYQQAAARVGQPFTPVPLHTSFRTLQGVLSAVDLVFAGPALRDAVLSHDEPVAHSTVRAETGGQVILWPPLQEIEDEIDLENWPLEAPDSLKSAPRRLAERIAGEIAGWLDARRPLGPRGRPVRPDDILILVQSRSTLFAELIRALGRRNIPSPGADRLPVTSHIAVLDLLALGDVLSNPADDLQLAALLRSPLFEVSEDELLAIAAGRPGTLWRALRDSTLATAQDAYARLYRWRGRLDLGRPFEFYAELLYREHGLKRFHARLGGEIDDVMTEFLELALAHEQTPNPSLQGFLAEMRARDISIRRELAEAAGGVRVMTVHGAKGLEAPIVILADAASRPGIGQNPPVYVVRDEPGPLFVHASAKAVHVAETLKLRDAASDEDEREYWRKLYVAMTRAEDELYITGYLTRKGKPTGTWYETVEAALADSGRRVEDAEGVLQALVYPAAEATQDGLAELPAGTAGSLAPLVLSALPRPAPVPEVSPSTAVAAVAPERLFDTAAERVIDAATARKSGTALHALLQHLGRVPRADWERIVEKALAVLLPDSQNLHAPLGRKAIAILSDPRFSALFGPDSRAEVPFLLEAKRNGRPVRLGGRIDRLVVANGRVLVIDYKSDAVPAGNVSEVPASYLTQVGLYALVASQLFPGLVVEAGILWTTLESLMILPQAVLRDAVSAFTMR